MEDRERERKRQNQLLSFASPICMQGNNKHIWWYEANKQKGNQQPLEIRPQFVDY